MKVNIVDLRYKMKDVLKALDRRERAVDKKPVSEVMDDLRGGRYRAV